MGEARADWVLRARAGGGAGARTLHTPCARTRRGAARDDTWAGRLARYHKCGKWFGKLCCCVAAVDWLYWQALEWWEPSTSIEQAPDFPNPYLQQRRQQQQPTLPPP